MNYTLNNYSYYYFSNSNNMNLNLINKFIVILIYYKMTNNEKFWLNDPKYLFSSTTIIPNCNMTNAERLNSITRLLFLTCLIMYVLGYEQYFNVFILGIILIVILNSYKPIENFQSNITNSQALNKGIRGFIPGYDSKPHVPPNKSCWFNQDKGLLNAVYEITPKIQFNHFDDSKRSYMNAKYELNPLQETDGFTQIWRNEPDMCGGYSMVPDPLTISPITQEDAPTGQCNYIVRSKIDHLRISPATNDLNSLRPMAEADFLQHSLDQRTAIMNEHIDRFRRERQHNCADMRLGSVSAGSGGTL